jgi:iron only hydrogenase large subunit-like protein
MYNTNGLSLPFYAFALETSTQFVHKMTQPLPLAGWICYAEKTLGSYILPYISSVKSPQQAIGAAIKHHVVEKLGLK